MNAPSLPTNPQEVFKLPFLDRIVFGIVIGFMKLTGLWKFPIRAYGDVERMRLIDKIYWIYKAANPTRRARRNSGLEDYFARQKDFRLELPAELQPEAQLSVSSVGDLMKHPYLANSKDTLYPGISDLVFGADIAMANLECPIFTKTQKPFIYAFEAPPPLYYDLDHFATVKGYQDKQFTFLATACNHSLDFELEGVESTLQQLDRVGIAYNGVNAQEEDADRVTIIEKNGFKIGAVAYTFGLNNHRPPEERPRIINLMLLNDGVAANDFRAFQTQLDYARAQGVDFMIAHLHWGLEHEFYPTPEQVELAHHLAELGVDAIIGHHPHVIQPMEFYQTKRDPYRIVPIYYSLGNLVNPFKASYLCVSGVARFDLIKGTLPNGSTRVYAKGARLLEVRQELLESEKKIRLLPA